MTPSRERNGDFTALWKNVDGCVNNIEIDDIKLTLIVAFDNGVVAKGSVERDGDDTNATLRAGAYAGQQVVKTELEVRLKPENHEYGPGHYRQEFSSMGVPATY